MRWRLGRLVEDLQEHGGKAYADISRAQRRPRLLIERARPAFMSGRREKNNTTVDKVQLWRQNRVRTSLLPLAFILGKVALVSVLIGCEPRGVFPPFFLSRKSTLDDVMA